jgi:tRNA-uridine 2-sulfurtransferase
VISTDVKENIVVVGEKEDKALFGKRITTTGRHRIGKSAKLPIKITAKIRYRQEPQPATLKQDKNNDIIVDFTKKQRAIAPGQTIVVYKDNECL